MKAALSIIAATALLLAPVVNAQSCIAEWGQCGGVYYTGVTCCVSGTTCVYSNDWYSQCLPGTNTPTTTSTTSSTSSKTSTTPSSTSTSTSTKTSTSTTSTSTTKTTTSTTSTTSSKTTTTSSSASPTTTSSAGNPFLNGAFYANPFYASEIAGTVADLTAAGNTALAAKAQEVESIGTAIWLDVAAKIPWVTQRLDDALNVTAVTGVQQVVTFVVYDLPDRDCAAAASNGEYTVADNGLVYYKAYIDGIAAAIAAHPNNHIVLVIEPDSLANLVTNLNVAKCAEAEPVYKAGIIYAIQKLNFANTALYLDAGHAGWLGWPANLGPAATLFSEILQGSAPYSIRGFATNVANYNAFYAATPDPITSGSNTPDEKSYIAAFTPVLQNLGVPANFIVDTSRNGVQDLRSQWGDWCNLNGAGFGVRPTTNTGVANVDAFVWIKPGGEADGTSNSSAPRFDYHCAASDAKQPAPQAGTWWPEYFEMLVTNAVPSL